MNCVLRCISDDDVSPASPEVPGATENRTYDQAGAHTAGSRQKSETSVQEKKLHWLGGREHRSCWNRGMLEAPGKIVSEANGEGWERARWFNLHVPCQEHHWGIRDPMKHTPAGPQQERERKVRAFIRVHQPGKAAHSTAAPPEEEPVATSSRHDSKEAAWLPYK